MGSWCLKRRSVNSKGIILSHFRGRRRTFARIVMLKCAECIADAVARGGTLVINSRNIHSLSGNSPLPPSSKSWCTWVSVVRSQLSSSVPSQQSREPSHTADLRMHFSSLGHRNSELSHTSFLSTKCSSSKLLKSLSEFRTKKTRN